MILLQNGTLHNSTLTLWYVTYQHITVTINRAPPTQRLIGHQASPNLALDMISHIKQSKFLKMLNIRCTLSRLLRVVYFQNIYLYSIFCIVCHPCKEKKLRFALSKNLLCEKIKKNRPGGDVISITQGQVKKKLT